MDDEAAILSATSEMLSFLGHQVTVAENGDEAIDLYKKAQTDAEPFDAVILDVTVPGGSGHRKPCPGSRCSIPTFGRSSPADMPPTPWSSVSPPEGS